MNGVFALPLLPLAGFLFAGLLGRRAGKTAVSVVCCGVMVAAFALALRLFLAHAPGQATTVVAWDWLTSGSLRVPIAFLVDPLSLVMLLVVTGVGTLIHVYSIGYMHADRGYHRYFAYLNLFVFFMLLLVLGDSLPLLFVGWEGVGLCSYLLIGFWYEKPPAADAGLKAFLVNRVGDFGFVAAMLLAFATFGTLSFSGIAAALPDALAGVGPGPIRLVALGLFFAATGKSAQIPLYIWLPDAMEGPSPVSALIHAATMVTSGIYLVARLGPLYAAVPDVLWWVGVVGAATALFAASMGLAATDIKKVLAYSTVSQLGYMFVGLGVGATDAAMFHLVTHAFFKACLFLGAGAVMHALAGETDLRRMGGLRARLPLTWAAMLAATLAIVGFPGSSGFASKDAILLAAWERHAWLPFGLAVATIGLTAFYMFRLLLLAFHGRPRLDPHALAHAHDATPSMAAALVPLALLSLAAGALNWPQALGGSARLSAFLAPVLAPHGAGAPAAHHPSAAAELLFSSALALPALAGFLLARRWYLGAAPGPVALADRFPTLYTLVRNRWFVDELVQTLVVKPWLGFSRWLWRTVDELVVDGLVNAVGIATQVSGELVRAFQTGSLRNYALYLALGALSVLVLVVL